MDSTGLMYYGARYYDPALARFITPDTVADRGTQGLNRYSYALNNPLKYNDPSGHAATSAYRASTPYNIAPYAGTFDTGSHLADLALGVGGSLWNLGASLLNTAASLVGSASETGYTAVETGYNNLTSRVLGDEGFTGNGFAEDMNAWIFATTSLPVEVAYVKQSLSVWKTYSSSMVVNAGGKVKMLPEISESTKQLMAELIADSNKTFPLSEINATKALQGPAGAIVEVAGSGGKGSDIIFRWGQNQILRREIKSIAGGYNSFNREISYAAQKQLKYSGEMFVQVQEGTNAISWINRFRQTRNISELGKYRSVNIHIVDTIGNTIFQGPLVP